MKEQPLISVIIPVYNAARCLAQCLDSVVGQTYSNLEIICVNDGSEDGSLEMLRGYADRDPRVRVLDRENTGVSSARNEALKLASGDYIMFVDADDWIEGNTCETAAAAMDTYSADIVLWPYVSETETRSSKKDIYEGLRVFEGEEVKSLHRRFVGLIGSELARPELADSLCPAWGKLYKKETIENVRFTDLREIGTYEDGLYNLEAFGKAEKAVYLPNHFYHYRRTKSESVTSGYQAGLFEQWQNLFGIMGEYIARNALPDVYREALRNRIALSIQGLGLNIVGSGKSVMWKRKEISRILGQPQYREAYGQLDFRYFPIHWKLFYRCAKMRFSAGVLVLLMVIHAIISR